jgi:hypothetical protein
MADLATLRGDLETLKSARRMGARAVQIADRQVTYRNDRELTSQIAALEAEIAAIDGTEKPRTIIIRNTKGW